MRILVVEDEPLLAMLMEESLEDLGHEMVGVAATVAQADAILDGHVVDAAFLDFSLADDATSVPVAERLWREGKPFYYVSGYNSIEPNGNAPHAPLLPKPFSLSALKDALDAMEGGLAAIQAG